MVVQVDIEQQINDLIDQTKVLDPEKSQRIFAQQLSLIIYNAILSATVTVAPGIPVTTAGSAVSQTGATTAPGTGSLA